ncbi:MAG: S9 family peptidase, partial [Acidobacteriota bacterium]
RPMTAEDLVMMDRVSDPRPSPDGAWVAYVLRSTDLEADRGRTDLWLVPSDGSTQPRQLTTHEASDYSPRWSPDGKGLYFLSSRSGSSQVWRLPLGGGEARQITDVPLDVGALVVAPDGRHLVVSMEVFPSCDTLACTTERLAAESTGDGLVFDRLFVRHWDTWKDGRRAHLFAIPLGDKGGEPIFLTPGFDGDIPSKPFGGDEEITVSRDGATVVFAGRVAGTTEPWSTNFDLYAVPIGGGALRQLTRNPALDSMPVFSPSGRTLAWLAMERPMFESDRKRLMVQSWPEGTPQVVADDFDRSIGGFSFADDNVVLATAQNIGEVDLFAITLVDGTVREIETGAGHVRSPSALPGGSIVYGQDSLTSPVHLYRLDAGSEPMALTDHNRARLDELTFGEYEQFTFSGARGETVYAYLVKPADYTPGQQYPIAFLIHGGPQGSFDDDFHYRWNPQIYAGAGYAAVMVDFHGSTGYGQAFTDSITGEWGSLPLEDLQKGLDHALGAYSWLDGERICALGASYGGYMINWIAGNWADRFDCLVNHDGLFDTRSMYYTTEELWFVEWEFGGTPWQMPESYARWNPALDVDKWQTPMLVIHGELDFRVPPEQGLATFTALQRRGIPSRLLWFHEENHWVLKPKNSLQWHAEVLSWLEQWTGE